MKETTARRLQWLAPLAVALTSLVWLFRNGPLFIFGEDSTLLVQPFSLNNSPLIPYNYLSGANVPLLLNFPSLYQDLFLQGLYGLSASPLQVQAVLVVFWSSVATIGVWLLTRRAALAWYGTLGGSFWPSVLAMSFFLVNPFSLTVIWWHWEGWTPFYCFLPLALWLLFSVYLERKVQWASYAATLLVGLMVAPGLSGTFAVAFGGLCLIVVIGIVLRRFVSERVGSPWIIPTVAVIALPLLLSAWSVIPSYVLPVNNTLGTSYGGNTLYLQEFFSQGATTQPWATFSLMGFSWIHNVPNAYAWGGATTIIYLSGALSAALFVTGALWIGSRRGLALLYGIGVPFLVCSMGAASPAEPALEPLVRIGGPFLIFVAPYYSLLEVYVAVLPVILFLIAREAVAMVSASPLLHKNQNSSGHQGTSRSEESDTLKSPPRRRPFRRISSSANRTAFLGAAGVAAVVLVSSLPWIQVADTGIYQTTGPNIGAFSLPKGYEKLDHFLQDTNYSTPDYFVLIIPLSRSSSVSLDTGGGSFVNTFSLVSSYVPYPTLFYNHTISGTIGVKATDQFYGYSTVPQLMNWLAAANLTGIGNLLRVMHVKFVVVDPYVNETNGFVSRAPSGQPIDWPGVYQALNRSLGQATQVGEFEVYQVPMTTPFLWVSPSVGIVSTSSMSDAFSLAALVHSNTVLGHWLTQATWSPTPVASATMLTPYPVDQASQRWYLPSGSEAYAVLTNGSVLTLPSPQDENYSLGYQASNQGATITSSLPTLASIENASSFSTNMALTNGSYQNSAGSQSTLRYLSTFSEATLIDANFSYQDVEGPNWVTVTLNATSYTIWASVFCNTYTNKCNLQLGAQVRSMTSPSGWASYGWNVVALPTFSSLPDARLTLQKGATSWVATLNSTALPAPVSASLYYLNRALVAQDPGHNLSAYPTGATPGEPYMVTLSTVYPSLNLTSFNIYRASTGVTDIAVSSSSLSPPVSEVHSLFGPTGKWTLTIPPSGVSSTLFLTLEMPGYPAWTLRSSSGATHALASTPAINDFEIVNASPATSLVLTLSFDTLVGAGILASAVIGVAAIGVLVAMAVTRVAFGRRHQGGSLLGRSGIGKGRFRRLHQPIDEGADNTATRR